MRSNHQIHDLIHKAMCDAMYEVWASLPAEEQKAYRLAMHGIEMAVYERKPEGKEPS